MTIVAGAIEDRRNLRTDLQVRVDRFRRIYRWIGSRRTDELNDDEGGEKNNDNPLEDAARFTHAHLFALEFTMKPGFIFCPCDVVSETQRN